MEEDIKIAKELIENKHGELLNCWDYGEEARKSLENILNELKRLQEENERLQKILDDLRNERAELVDKVQELKNDLEHDGLAHKYLTLKATSIPKQVIRDKIEYLEKIINDLHPASDIAEIEYYEDQIDILKELLGE